MAEDPFSYRPRHGFDIRIKPTKGSKNSKKSWAKTEARTCDHEGCDKPAETRAPKAPDAMNEYLWLCTEHAREHNKNWNFFDGKTDAQAAQMRDSARYGDRPTWKMSKNGRASAAARAGMEGMAEIDDAVGGNGGVETFQAPGLEMAEPSEFDARNARGTAGAHHHDTKGDLVHRAGSSDLDGKTPAISKHGPKMMP